MQVTTIGDKRVLLTAGSSAAPGKVSLPQPNTTAHFTVLIPGADPLRPGQYLSPHRPIQKRKHTYT